MKTVTKQEFAQWVNNVIADNSTDIAEMQLIGGYRVTMAAVDKYAYLKKGLNYYGDYDFWRFGSIEAMIDEIWLDFSNSIEHDKDCAPYCKAGGVELTYTECDRIARQGKLIVAYRDIYRLQWSNAQGRYYATKMYHYDGELGLTKRGRWVSLTPREVNHLIGFELFATETIVEQKVKEAMERLKALQPA
jgi:hypothetical protein